LLKYGYVAEFWDMSKDIDILWDALITRVSTEGNASTGKPKDKILEIKDLTGPQENKGALNA